MTDCSTQRHVVESLREENAQLHHTLRRLRDELFTPSLVHPSWGLSNTECRIFNILARRHRVTCSGILIALFSHRHDQYLQEMPQTHISKMRRKLAPFGIRITSERNLGYRLEGYKHETGS